MINWWYIGIYHGISGDFSRIGMNLKRCPSENYQDVPSKLVRSPRYTLGNPWESLAVDGLLMCIIPGKAMSSMSQQTAATLRLHPTKRMAKGRELQALDREPNLQPDLLGWICRIGWKFDESNGFQKKMDRNMKSWVEVLQVWWGELDRNLQKKTLCPSTPGE